METNRSPFVESCDRKITRRAPQTIHSEVKDGTVRQIRRQVQNGKTYEYESFVYSADAGQAAYENARTNSRKQLKWVSSPKFMAYADHQMKTEKQAPDVVVGRAKKLGLFPNETIPCTTTLYTYIDLGWLETKNIDLHLKVRRNTKRSQSRKNKKSDWEIDTVNGLRVGKDQALLTLTERKTRYEIIIKIDGKAANPVDRALTALKEAAGNDFEVLFKTITSDNGAEFAGLTTLLKDITEVYFTHPYSSWERGTNENHNGMIRRFIPKGTRMEDVALTTIRRVQDWMNNLPRRILGYATPRECLLNELSELSLAAR